MVSLKKKSYKKLIINVLLVGLIVLLEKKNVIPCAYAILYERQSVRERFRLNFFQGNFLFYHANIIFSIIVYIVEMYISFFETILSCFYRIYTQTKSIVVISPFRFGRDFERVGICRCPNTLCLGYVERRKK